MRRVRTSDERRHVDRDCSVDLRQRIYQAIAAGISGQGILRGERLPDLVARVCPGVVMFSTLEGYTANLDLPENTHEALCLGQISVEIRRARH